MTPFFIILVVLGLSIWRAEALMWLYRNEPEKGPHW